MKMSFLILLVLFIFVSGWLDSKARKWKGEN
ncbi:MAG: hypothetical protein K0Q56_768 [Sporolactobacillus laevolacticus]|jgi:hypothetical protein|nr:hypothetical protein [Sporolactobacillus laevolacticus]